MILAGLQAELLRAPDLIVWLHRSMLERSARFCARMHLPATQIMYSAPWKIPVDALETEAVQIGLQEIFARRPQQALDKVTDKSMTLPGF